MNSLRRCLLALFGCCLLFFCAISVLAQETTAGLQGTVKDQSGAVVANANVAVIGTTLVGEKTTKTDNAGYYRLANLPPGTYTITVTAQGFATQKKEGVALEVGHLPTLDFSVTVGKTETVVEVSSEAPLVDVTTNHTMTNVTEDVINNAPHGYSFQSMIQFAPMARNEPLAGGQMVGGGTGGSLPGSSGNGGAVGYSIGGAADSENGYLVDGLDTENISGGYSNANVPYEFIQEVQIKTSGIEAEYGGALGGVVNVSSWGPYYFETEKGYTLTQANTLIAISAICGILGTACSGFVSDKFFKGNRNIPTLIFGLMNVLGLMLFLLGPKNVWWFDVISMILFGFAIGALICFLGGLFVVDIVSKKASGAALGIVGIMSYAAAGIQDIASGYLIESNKTIVNGETLYDFTSITVFWIGAGILSVICALFVWNVANKKE